MLWLDADDLVSICLKDVAAGKVISIPSVRYRVIFGLIRHLPRATVRAISRRITSSRH
jgi:uncharacterized protein